MGVFFKKCNDWLLLSGLDCYTCANESTAVGFFYMHHQYKFCGLTPRYFLRGGLE